MEEKCSGTSNKSWPKDDFTDLLFSWSLTEILDDDLYKYQVEKIPDSFETVEQYLSSYVYPLLEDTRAALASSLENVYKAPFAEVTSLTNGKPGIYDVKVDHWRNKTSDRGKEPYRTLPGDLLLLSDSKPESVSVLQRIGWSYTFASVTKISEDKNGDSSTSSDFQLRTACNIQVGDQQSKSFYVVFLENMTTNKRIWDSIKMRQHPKIIEKVLIKNDLGDINCELCPKRFNSEVEDKLLSTFSSKLNESQLGAVMACIHKIGCDHNPSVELIWGPPGTGKTSTLSTLLYILLGMNVRTLICAPTNTAIKALAAQVVELVRNSVKTERGSVLTCPLGGMILFGNNDRLKVDSDIEEIFSDYRVDRLTEILVPLTGWRHCVSSMLDFLEHCVSQHQIFVENEQIKSNSNTDCEIAKAGSKSFLEFARERFTNLAASLRRCMLIIITHCPRSFIYKGNYEKIVQLFDLIDSLEKFLYVDGGMTSKDLETMFLQEVLTGSESFIDKTSLLYIRSQCLCILRSLWASLSQVDFPTATSKISTTEFCFRNASLIFCTVSSAFKLRSVDMDPFQLLVIDEAAQVKECETTIALQIKEIRHAILVGDECQLPATVFSKLSEEAGFGRSLFERLSSMGNPKHLLNVQYRMHPSISQFPNSNFYQNQILDGPNVQSISYVKSYLQGKMFGPYSFINVRGGREELDDVGLSRRNMVEVAVIVKLVKKLLKAWNGSKEKLSIGLISPYAAQVAAIRDKLQPTYDNLKRFTVKVKSIDGFQGGEEDIIIISTVRSHRGGSIGFLCSPQRTNVALTRARHCLWILGNETTLSKSDSVWQAIVSDAKARHCFFNADEDSDIGKAIIDVKKELDQLDDLISGDSILFKNSRWQVLFSDNFRKSFRKLRFSSTKKLAINLLLKLAGGWRPSKVNVDRKCESSSYIVKQFKVDVYYVVCSIDIMKDAIYEQVLKVWDILPRTDTTKLLKRLDNIFSLYTDDFINRCNDKLFERNLEVPRSWSLSSDIVRFKNPSNPESITSASSSSVCRTYVESSRVSESLLLMKFYSLSSGTVNHLLSDAEGKEVDLPFEVTDEEREIINFPRSSFILGRSGTGKTTILTMKLYKKLQQFSVVSQDSIAAEDNVSITDEVDQEQNYDRSRRPVLRQLFVTVSPKLCHAVKKNVAQIKSIATQNLPGLNNTTSMDDVDDSEFKDIPDSFVGIEEENYPLILTFHKFLMMLDGTVGESYFQRFSKVKHSSHSEGRRSIALGTFLRLNEVTYDRFSSIYWPHFNEKLTKSLDSSSVFTEIMSHIKGGLQDEECEYKRSRHDYISLSESRISTLCAEQRDAIYDIFEHYEKLKMERGEFDLADFVSDIHLRLRKEDIPCHKMEFVYIDEVQDLTMRQLSLFKYICCNVDEGFIFSGDTAQTIAKGVDFRFEDIRSLFYNEFLMRFRNSGFLGKKEKGLVSDMFNLSQNFRTHTGVLRLAQSVVDLISYYFPNSIDVLAPETSRIYGESPLVLESGSGENLIISLFGHSGKWVGFGADQVIIVRDDSARHEISSYIGHQALVLTIVESKGLEFQDVLLYNFFSSSPLSHQWRVVYEYLNERNLLDGDTAKSFPNFSNSRHNILCSELKQLYVAITRTRQRLWICENNVEVSKPMLDYWRRLSLVQVRKIDDSLSESMQRASTHEEWKSQGIKLLWEKNYEMATMCFEKAGEETLRKNAIASGLRAAAEKRLVSSSEEATTMLREAAEIFDSIERFESAAECFYELRDYERAGRIYRDKCGRSELGKAGECFLLAGKHELAAEVYARGNFFRECLSACSKGNDFDLGLHYIDGWRRQAQLNSPIMAEFAQEFLENCAQVCHRRKDKTSFMKFVRSFCSNDSKRVFLKSLDCLDELLDLEEELGNFIVASKIAKSLGNTLREVDLLEKAREFANACAILLSYVISNTLWGSGNPGWPFKPFPLKVELLNRAMSIALNVSETFHATVSAKAKILLHEQNNLSDLMQFGSASKQCETSFVEILIVRKLLDAHFKVNANKYELDHEFDLSPSSFEERIGRNQVSVAGLVYLWNSWNAHSLKILQCFDSLERTDSMKLEGVVEFCCTYFGLRLLDNSSVTLHLLNPDAEWVKSFKGFIRWNRNVAALEARHFALAARKFWLQELVSIGLTVLDTLQKLVKSPKPVHCKSLCLLHIFNISNFILHSKSIDMEHNEEKKLHNEKKKLHIFAQECTEYLEFAFPLDPRESLLESMISLRGTAHSRDLLGEIILRNIRGKKELSSWQIGRTMMTMLGSSKLQHGIYDEIAGRLEKDSPWIPVIHILKGKKSTPSVDGISPELLSRALHKALEETYNIHWRSYDYISPHCFLYLMERLLILAPHPRGFFYTTKSSFVEYLISLPSDSNPGTSLVTDNSSHSRATVDFILHVVEHYLFNEVERVEWIKKSGINCNSYMPVVVLRLLMILCVLCINWGLSFDMLNRKMSRFDIKSQLPKVFCEALRPRRWGYVSFVSAVASAFKGIGDPLLIVVSGGNIQSPHPDVVYLNLRSFSCTTDVMENLFPRSTGTANDQPATVETNSIIMPPVSDEGKNADKQSSDGIQEISKVFEALKNRDNGNMESLFWRKKVEVENHIKFITCAAAQLQGPHSCQDNDFEGVVNCFIQDLNTLLGLFLCTSDYGSEAMTEIDKVFARLDEERMQLDALLSTQNDPKTVLVSEREDSDINLVEEDSKKGATCSRGKGKEKKNNNPKKGKGRRKK